MINLPLLVANGQASAPALKAALVRICVWLRAAPIAKSGLLSQTAGNNKHF
jgi:hypothetical protein